MYGFSFERLEVWKESKLLVKRIYELTIDFPSDEKFGLTSQLRRASISIASNLAEELSFITKEDYLVLRDQIQKISNMLNGLRKSQLNS